MSINSNINPTGLNKINKTVLFISLLSCFFTLIAQAEESQFIEEPKAISKHEETKQYLIAVAQNDTKDEEHHFITQKELQETLRLIHRDKLSFLDMQNIQHEIEELIDMDIDQRAEASRLLYDIIIVEGRMNDYRLYSYNCRFSLRDDPYLDVARDSILKRPDLYRDQFTKKEFEDFQKADNKRAVIGLCWAPKLKK